MTATSFKIGFHGGPEDYMLGIGDHWRALDAAGLPAVFMSADYYGPCFELAEIARTSGVDHQILFRLEGWIDGFNHDVPRYDLSPEEAAELHWFETLTHLPPEFDRVRVWLVMGNEVDKRRADWLGRWAVHLVDLARQGGYRIALFGFSSGEPEPEDWETPGMRAFLELAAAYPDQVAVALHEYSYELDDIKALFPNRIGRFQQLFAACDRMGIARPTVHITEWGWTHDRVPDVPRGLEDVRWAAQLYAAHPQIRSAAIWYLGGGFGDIARRTQPYIAPLTQMALEPGWVAPRKKRGAPRYDYPRNYILFKDTMPATQVVSTVRQLAEQGLRPTCGFSFDDAGIGDLSNRTVHFSGFSAAEYDSYDDWFARYYGGVSLVHPVTGEVRTTPLPSSGQRGAPRVQYARRYLVFHPKAPISACLDLVLDRLLRGERPTFGWSFDDAGIGDLNDRTVEVIGCPDGEKASYAKWYGDEYAGVNVTFTAVSGFADGFDAPVGTLEERRSSKVWPGTWQDATGWAKWYRNPSTGKSYYHTGADLNNNQPAWDSDRNAPVYAAASGRVAFSGWRNTWGNIIVIRHDPLPGGQVMYGRYAHLGVRSVGTGARVARGQQIGTVGRDAGGGPYHLHFDLSPTSILEENPTDWPGADLPRLRRDYVDPRAFILDNRPPGTSPALDPPPPVGTGSALFGLHAGADGGRLSDQELADFAAAKVELIKVLSSTVPESVSALARQHPAATWIIRAFLSFRGRTLAVNPAAFVEWTASDIRRTIAAIRNAGATGPIYLEIHNEPNLNDEGLGTSWSGGATFAAWLQNVLGLYRVELQGVRFLFPGLSPGGSIPGVRYDSWAFLQEARAGVIACDGLAVHAYWAAGFPMASALADVDRYIALYPTKPLWVTEASNNKAGPTPEQKAADYVSFWRELRRRPAVKGVTFFVASASDPAWGWNGGSAEVWAGTPIAAITGRR